mgnify:CR=1 FL=1
MLYHTRNVFIELKTFMSHFLSISLLTFSSFTEEVFLHVHKRLNKIVCFLNFSLFIHRLMLPSSSTQTTKHLRLWHFIFLLLLNGDWFLASKKSLCCRWHFLMFPDFFNTKNTPTTMLFTFLKKNFHLTAIVSRQGSFTLGKSMG